MQKNEDTLRDYYKILLESINKYEDRKNTIHTFFITLNSALITCFGFMLSSQDKMPSMKLRLGFVAVGCIGLLTIFEWKKLIGSFNHQLTIKNMLVTELEKKLSIDLFTREKAATQEDFPTKSRSFFIENKIPLTLIGIYLFLFGLAIF